MTKEPRGTNLVVPASANQTNHLVEVDGVDWKLGRWMALRATGFATSTVQSLSTSALSAYLERMLEADVQLVLACEQASAALNSRIAEVEDEQQRAHLAELQERLEAGHTVRAEGNPALVDALEAHRRAVEVYAALEEGFSDVFARESTEIYSHLRSVAADPTFREAITWQNHALLSRCLDSLLRHPNRNNSDARRKLETVARYLQRYCTKNDTIGFFGPVGWAQIGAQFEGIKQTPGSDFLAERRVFFETWGIDLLAKNLSKDARFKPWIRPERHPFVRIEGDSAHPIMGPAQPLSAEQRAVIGACDGQRTARQVAALVIADAHIALDDEEQVFELLDDLSAYVTWQVEVPVSLHPERALRAAIETVEDDALRAELIAPLEQLEQARQRVADAAGNPEALGEAIKHLNLTFTEVTDEEATRRAGELYAGRTLVIEECKRDLTVQIGTDVFEDLMRPMSLLLNAARWQSYEIGQRFEAHCEATYDRLVDEDGSGVDVAKLFFSTMQARQNIQQEVVEEFKKKWAEILELPDDGAAELRLSSAHLRERVEKAFAAPHPGWSYARVHSPDVMISADGPDAIERGDYHFVLGEVHPSWSTLQQGVFHALGFPDKELRDQTWQALQKAQVLPAFAKQGLMGYDMARLAFVPSEHDFLLQFEAAPYDHPDGHVLPIADLVVKRRDEGLFVESRDGRLEFELLEFFGFILGFLIVPSLRLLEERDYLPRIVIDDLVVQREQWHIAPDTLDFADVSERHDRFLCIRRWAARQGFPRYCFIKFPQEKKPEFIDWDSPVLADVFWKAVRQAQNQKKISGKILVSSMEPRLDQAWVVDSKGEHYTGELRMIVVDPRDVD